MSPPKHELVVQDCDEAIKLDSKYVKAINRRAIALENLERYQEALRGKFIVRTLSAQAYQRFHCLRLYCSYNIRPIPKSNNGLRGRAGIEGFGYEESEGNHAS